MSYPPAGAGPASGDEGVEDPRAASPEVDTLRFDLAARTAVDLATGILMEQRGIGAEDALALLEHLSDQITVASAAEGIVELRSDETGRAQGSHRSVVPEQQPEDAETTSSGTAVSRETHRT